MNKVFGKKVFGTKVFYAFFEGETELEQTPEQKAAADKAEADAKATTANKTFTQDELNTILAKDRKIHEERIKKTVADLEKLNKSKSLSEQEKNNLQIKIDELNNTLLTKEELAAQERKKLESSHKKTVEELNKERDNWKNRYTESTILRTISDAAVVEGAFNSKHIIAILNPMTQLKEETDSEGNPTGKFIPRVAYNTIDKEGKQVTLDLTIPEAVKRMKETPEEYGPLFKSTAAGGTGTLPAGGSPGSVDVTRMTPDQYKEYRKTIGLGRKSSPVLK